MHLIHHRSLTLNYIIDLYNLYLYTHLTASCSMNIIYFYLPLSCLGHIYCIHYSVVNNCIQDSTPAGWVNILETTRLPECLVEPPPNQPYCFTITTPSREYFINADTGEDMYDWIQALRTAKHYLGAPSKFGNRKVSEILPHRIEQLAQEVPTRATVHKRKVNGKVFTNCAHGTQVGRKKENEEKKSKR